MTKYKNIVDEAFRLIPDLPSKTETEQDEIEKQGEILIDQSVQISEQTKEIEEMLNDTSSE